MHRIVNIMLIAALMCGAARAAEPTPIHVLILSGQNNHNWKQTTPKLKAILEADELCVVDVTERPEMLTAETLKPYDVILSNWNTFGRGKNVVKTWPDVTKSVYVDFVRSGKGHIVVHAGSTSFYEWPEYQQICLATWKNGQTGHGPRHTFDVRIDAKDHSVAQGLTDFKTHDELWRRAEVQAGATVIASAYSDAKIKGGTGRWEPIALAGSFGRGRCFTLLLGHDASGMNTAGFQTLLRHGVSWTANNEYTEH